MAEHCDVYWGSHGCKFERGHAGPHICDCADDPDIDPATKEYRSEPGVFNVGSPPYYGPETRFYGDDVFEGPHVEPLPEPVAVYSFAEGPHRATLIR